MPHYWTRNLHVHGLPFTLHRVFIYVAPSRWDRRADRVLEVKGFWDRNVLRAFDAYCLSAASGTISLLVMHYAIVMPIDAPNDDAQDTDSTNRPIDFAAQHMSVTSSDSRSVVYRLTCNECHSCSTNISLHQLLTSTPSSNCWQGNISCLSWGLCSCYALTLIVSQKRGVELLQ